MSALALRIIASISMLLDHIGYCLYITPLRWVGRLAFPLYVFLMVNGFRHTKNRLNYALRLALFALISQLPFALMCYDQYDYPKLNVMVTLLLGLLVIWSGEALRKNKITRWFCLAPAFLVFCAYYFGYISSDYGEKGVLLAVVFWLFEGKKLLTILGAFCALFYPQLLSYGIQLLRGATSFALLDTWTLIQLLALLSLPLIFLYNGKSGHLPQNRLAKKSIQLGFYTFYPAHMLVLWLLFR